ncbi:MAG: hypothetical protein EXR52_06385 [Dehalococcoidia bacterium]|nr:hypothetical protein [Dehalococcoidia bacterium]
MTGGFRRDPAARQCTQLDPGLGPTCWDWHLQGWKGTSSGGFAQAWQREAFDKTTDATGMVHGLAVDPNKRDFYAVGCANTLGPHGSRGCFIAGSRSEADWHGQWQRWDINTGR